MPYISESEYSKLVDTANRISSHIDRPLLWVREVDAGTDNACFVPANRMDTGAVPVYRYLEFANTHRLS